MPFDFEPTPAGLFCLDAADESAADMPRAVWVAPQHRRLCRRLYAPHFQTCPYIDQKGGQPTPN